jgi:Mg-chelatase subunit ChlD
MGSVLSTTDTSEVEQQQDVQLPEPAALEVQQQDAALKPAEVLNIQQAMLQTQAPEMQQVQQNLSAGPPGRMIQRRSMPTMAPPPPRASPWSNSSPLTPIAERSFCDDDVVHDNPEGGSTGLFGWLQTAQPEPEVAPSADAVVTVSTRVEYSALPRGETKDVFGLISVQAASLPAPEAGQESATAQERQPMDLVCVLDVSGSMRGSKIRQVQDAVRCVVEQCTAKDRLSIVSFNHEANRVSRLQRMDTQGKDAANVANLRLNSGGGTSIAAGLSTGIAVMEQRRQRNKVSAVLLLTDGQDRSAQYSMPALLTRASEARCSVYAFGFGEDHDASLLSQLAEQAHTPFTYVEDTEKIQEAFAGAVGGLSSVVAQNIQLTLTGAVNLKTIHTDFAVQRSSDSKVVVTIPDLYAGEKRDVLVEMSVPAGSEGSELQLLEAQARYTDLQSNSMVQTIPVTMQASCVDEPQPEDEPDQEVTAQRERVEVTRTLKEASMYSDQGNFTQAQQVLQSEGMRMKSKKMKTHMNEALCQELDDARNRMQNSSMWERGGRAEVADACQMHSMQRCTNLNVSSKTGFQKQSKAMYCNSSSVNWISSISSKSGSRG